jgi:hypothetical protein
MTPWKTHAHRRDEEADHAGGGVDSLGPIQATTFFVARR